MGNRLARKICHFFRDEEGQSTTEYILILAVVVLVAVRFRKTFEQKMGELTTKLFQDIDSNISGQ